MSLTDKALRERMWGEFPTLSTILENKELPNLYFGASSASDNIFDQIVHTLKLAILIHENKIEIIQQLKGASHETRGNFARDFGCFREKCEWAEKIFRDARMENSAIEY